MSTVVAAEFEQETCRLRLRLLNAGDNALFRGLYADTDIMRFIGPAMTPAKASRTFDNILARMRRQPPACVYLAILDRASGYPFGICGLPEFSPDAIRQEVGLVLTRQAWSRGIAREGLAALVDRVFATSSADEVWSRFSTKNLAAQRLVLAVGFNACNELWSGEGLSSESCWSVRRSSWRSTERITIQGTTDVERDRFS